MAHSSTPASPVASRLTTAGLILTLLSPLTVFVAVVGLKAGLWPMGMAYDTLTMTVGLWLAGLGVLGAVIAIVGGAIGFRRFGLIALVAVVVSALTVSLFVREMAVSSASPQSARGASTDLADPLGFSNAIMAERRADNADALASGAGSDGCAITRLPTQVAPGVAGFALREAGFTIRDLGVNRGSGVYVSPVFDRTYDAVIRIRPGRTDVRVEPRDGDHDRGTSCRLAARILEELQPSR